VDTYLCIEQYICCALDVLYIIHLYLILSMFRTTGSKMQSCIEFSRGDVMNTIFLLV
jgi:hypothetical protein